MAFGRSREALECGADACRPQHQSPAAVRAVAGESMLRAIGAEGAFKAADARRRVGGQILITTFAIGT